jgi:hypothetical protein
MKAKSAPVAHLRRCMTLEMALPFHRIMRLAYGPHLRRCMTLEMALPFHRIMRLAYGPHLSFLRGFFFLENDTDYSVVICR